MDHDLVTKYFQDSSRFGDLEPQFKRIASYLERTFRKKPWILEALNTEEIDWIVRTWIYKKPIGHKHLKEIAEGLLAELEIRALAKKYGKQESLSGNSSSLKE